MNFSFPQLFQNSKPKKMTTTTQTPEHQQPIKEPLSLSQDVQFLILLLTIEGLLQEQENILDNLTGPRAWQVEGYKNEMWTVRCNLWEYDNEG